MAKMTPKRRDDAGGINHSATRRIVAGGNLASMISPTKGARGER